MKKLFLFLLFVIFIALSFSPKTSVIFAENIYFGRVLGANVYLYSSPTETENSSTKFFMLPITYFVQILGEENELFYKAEYNGIFGYIKKAEVSCINQTPKKPYASGVSFRVFTPSGANLRSSPNETSGIGNLVTTIPFMCTNLEYFGQISGEEAISYKGDIWYYCKYVKDNKEYFGYVYSPLCDLLSNIPQNTEVFEYITPNFSQIKQTETDISNYLSISKPRQVIIIIAICLPCIFIIYFLFKPTKIAMQKPSNKKSKKEKKKISRLKHSDYYEFDSDYFN